MIKNSVLYYGMPESGKTTLMLKTAINDYKKYHMNDLCINLWTFLHPSRFARTATLNDLSCPHGKLRALRLPYNPQAWITTLSGFYKRHPHIHRVMIDECQCVSSVYLVTLVMLIRDFYPNVSVMFASIDYDSWHHKLPRIQDLIDMTPESHHLHHICMFCQKRIATRRLHVVNHKPVYDQKKYDDILRYHDYSRSGRPKMYSVCSKHYRNLPSNFEEILKKNTKKSISLRQQFKAVKKHLGSNANIKISK